MTDVLILAASLGIGFFVAFTIGANDETMAPAVGAGLVSVTIAAIISGIFNFIGVFFLGRTVSKTVGNDLSQEPLTLGMIFVVLISMAIWMLIISVKGIPISTTQSIVGSVLGVVLVEWGLSGINGSSLFFIILSWVISPLIGLLGGFLFFWSISRFRASLKIKGYADYERQEVIASYALAIFLMVTIISRGGNDVAKAIGPLMAIEEFSLNPFPALLAGGLGMCLGVIVIGRKVIKKLSKEIIALSPVSALSASISVSLIMFFGTLLGIPLSGSHILIAAFIGVGLVKRESVNMDSIKEIGLTFVVTAPISAIFSGVMYIGYKVILLPLFVT